jgi:site-specific DNA-cytosine methylase
MVSRTKLRMFDAFSGVAGFTKGLERHCETVAYAESDVACVSILTKLMVSGDIPRARIFEDITLVAKGDVSCDIMTAGFPCQDIAGLGPGTGIRGLRSSLVYQVFRILNENSIPCVFLENSPMVVTRGMKEILAELEKLGMHCVWGIFYARDAGALHMRKRWYCLGFESLTALSRVRCRRDALTARMWPDKPVSSRLVPKQKENKPRLAALGNAVVPQCANLAFETLVSMARKGSSGRIVPERLLSLVLYRPLMLPGSSIPRTYGTPTHTHWTQSSALNNDMRRNFLANQLFWDQATWKWFKKEEVKKKLQTLERNRNRNMSSESSIRNGNMISEAGSKRKDLTTVLDINPHWVENFMGFPRGWTDLTITVADRKSRSKYT